MKFATLVMVALLTGCMNPLPHAPEDVAVTPATQPAPTGGAAQVAFIEQEQDSWCWLAVTEMIGKALTGLDVPQCEMAGEGCCDSNAAQCDHEGLVPNALESAYGLKSSFVPFDATVLRTELLAGRPVGIDYFNTVRGHSVLLAAYEPARGFQIMDPLVGQYWVTDASVSLWYGAAARMIIVN